MWITNYLVYQPLFKSFQKFIGTCKTFAWKSKGLLEESFKTPVTSDNSFVPEQTFTHNGKMNKRWSTLC